MSDNTIGKRAYSPYTEEPGGLVFTSGQVSMRDEEIVPGTFHEQLHLATDNLKDVLASAGLTMDDVKKATIFMLNKNPAENARNYRALNDFWVGAFEGPCPARTVVFVAALPFRLCVEIEAIAARPGSGTDPDTTRPGD